jgi:hypothetical protein
VKTNTVTCDRCGHTAPMEKSMQRGKDHMFDAVERYREGADGRADLCLGCATWVDAAMKRVFSETVYRAK